MLATPATDDEWWNAPLDGQPDTPKKEHNVSPEPSEQRTMAPPGSPNPKEDIRKSSPKPQNPYRKKQEAHSKQRSSNFPPLSIEFPNAGLIPVAQKDHSTKFLSQRTRRGTSGRNKLPVSDVPKIADQVSECPVTYFELEARLPLEQLPKPDERSFEAPPRRVHELSGSPEPVYELSGSPKPVYELPGSLEPVYELSDSQELTSRSVVAHAQEFCAPPSKEPPYRALLKWLVEGKKETPTSYIPTTLEAEDKFVVPPHEPSSDWGSYQAVKLVTGRDGQRQWSPCKWQSTLQ